MANSEGSKRANTGSGSEAGDGPARERGASSREARGLQLERALVLDTVRVTEQAAIAASRVAGKGDSDLVDQAGTDAMRRVLNELDINGEIVIGEGERDEAPMLYIGEKLGRGGDDAWDVDIAVDPVEGTGITARMINNAVAVIALSERGGLFQAPDTYMEKLIVGPPAKGKVDLTWPVAANLRGVALSLDRDVDDLTVVILDRERHTKLIQEVRDAGARVKLIGDGDVIAALSAAVRGTNVHAVMGTGGGFILVPLLNYLLRVPTSTVIGTSMMLTLITMTFATVLHAATNHLVDAVLALILMTGGVTGAQFGARAGQRIRGEHLRLLLGLLILAVGIRFAIELGIRPGDLYTVRETTGDT